MDVSSAKSYVTPDPVFLEDLRYGRVKYSNDAKTTSSGIGSLKSRLDRKLLPGEKWHGDPTATTTVSYDMQTYPLDTYNTLVTPDNLYFANDSAVPVNRSATKVFQDTHWPVKKEAVVEGDVIIGGLMMVHEREDSITCGPIMPQGGVQALEAMLYTLDQINLMIKPFLPNITLGAHILDDCDKDTYGLEMAVDFIKG
ncbi:hypothetical protein NQ318_008647 [Aromia moschata]|uniref:Receptor ligand binding region domain-containing protein n=1 Tax=Aromia moschata TaxID=1265417 RepID=A0AAV8XSH3_9CUCU|nr:hypothetical protein NQ318_008647 [Aromia moschata]